jgi:hypothetical protein
MGGAEVLDIEMDQRTGLLYVLAKPDIFVRLNIETQAIRQIGLNRMLSNDTSVSVLLNARIHITHAKLIISATKREPQGDKL